MPNYQNSKIYTIRCKLDDSLIYVGSTTQPLSKRMVEHRSKHNKEYSDTYTKPLYVKMRDIGIEHFYIELYKDFPCERKEQLEQHEGEIIRDIGTLNKVIAGIQWRKNRKENDKKNYEEKKDIILGKNKIYRQEHKEQIKEQQRQKYLNNIESLREKITCSCGCILTKFSLLKHTKTQKHIQLMEALNNSENSVEVLS
jgi:hypothetical protein